MSSFGRKMGMLQLGLLSMGVALFVVALAVKAERAQTPSSLSSISPAAGESVSSGVSAGYEGADVVEAVPGASMDGDDVVVPDAPAEMPCEFGHWVGAPVNEAAVKEMGRPYRILPPGSMATMDYSPARINVETDEAGTVTKVSCG